MNYELWKIFLDAVELGSLSKVAMLHNTNQPQISRQMNELEAQCGGRLFNRTGRGVELTDLGQHLLPKIRSWLNRRCHLPAIFLNARLALHAPTA